MEFVDIDGLLWLHYAVAADLLGWVSVVVDLAVFDVVAPNNNNQPQNTNQQQQTAQQAPGLCSALEHAGATTGVFGAAAFLWGTVADTTVVGVVIGVPVQTVGGIGMAVGTIGYGIGDAGIALGLCH